MQLWFATGKKLYYIVKTIEYFIVLDK